MADTQPLPPDENRGPQILAICGSMVGLTLALVLLRVWVRVRMIRSFGWDDIFMVAAMTVLFVEMMIIIPQVNIGAGRHYQYIVPASNIVAGLHLNFVTQPLCLIALLLAKVSVGFFLLRMAPSPRFRYFIIGTIVFTVLSATGNILTVFFQCRPLAFTWDASIPGGQCIPAANLKFAAFFNSSVSVFTDFLFALLPVPMLWNVQLNWKVKSAVAGILSLGVFAAVAAIVKITFLPNYGKHGDFLWDSTDITIWTTIEICTAMIAACFPCLKPLFKAILSGSSAAKYASKYPHAGYTRKNDSTNGTVRSRAAKSGTYEMYGRSRTNTAHAIGGLHTKMDSEESILPQPSNSTNGITKTMQVSVSVDDDYHKSSRDLE
ncbi:hypothetical protein QBC46DRAFT_155181 [Diplogelasinospora grovesii]|uniref:Rhodopsin domain-containing protein n=1 Tax=Diplogelasinospora grovesii TaxID=303347 RepID=A0AAN6N4C7_9PEZI|nr:hypothetical protein QBC46DRAFT_155181 [Diplogelasinospora grovesii]